MQNVRFVGKYYIESSDRAEQKCLLYNNMSRFKLFALGRHCKYIRAIGNKQRFTFINNSLHLHIHDISLPQVRDDFRDSILYKFPIRSSIVCFLHQFRVVSPSKSRRWLIYCTGFETPGKVYALCRFASKSGSTFGMFTE